VIVFLEKQSVGHFAFGWTRDSKGASGTMPSEESICSCIPKENGKFGLVREYTL
jgi:hypothetical protein